LADPALTSEQLEKELQESQALFNISQMLAGTIDLPTTLGQIAEAATSLIKTADRTALHLLDETESRLEPMAVAGLVNIDTSSSLNFRPGEGIAGLVLSSGKTILVSDVLVDPRYIPVKGQKSAVRSLLVAPIQTDQKKLGTLSVQSPVPGVFNVNDERLLTILGIQAALAIDKAQLYADLHAALEHEKSFRTQLVQAEKLAALGRIVASVAHELNNPLQAIQNALYLIQMEESLSDQAKEDLRTVLAETERMASLIARLREIYRPINSEEIQLESLNLLILEVQTLLNTHLRRNKISFNFLPDHNLPMVPMIRDQFRQVVLNICLNAVEAMPDGGDLTVKLSHSPANKEVYLLISDNGVSISPQILPYIFDPFVTTKEGGTGLGLAITFDIVQRHNGRIDVTSEPGSGTTFLVTMPLSIQMEPVRKTRRLPAQ
jgi:signal transduction histidine kinase